MWRGGTPDYGSRLFWHRSRGRSDPAAVRTLRCRTVAQGRFSQLNPTRDLPPQPVMEGEPESSDPGGLLIGSLAPHALKALLAALKSCLAVGIHANAILWGTSVQSPVANTFHNPVHLDVMPETSTV